MRGRGQRDNVCERGRKKKSYMLLQSVLVWESWPLINLMQMRLFAICFLASLLLPLCRVSQLESQHVTAEGERMEGRDQSNAEDDTLPWKKLQRVDLCDFHHFMMIVFIFFLFCYLFNVFYSFFPLCFYYAFNFFMAVVVRQYWSKLLSGPALFRLCCKLGVSNPSPGFVSWSLINFIFITKSY